MYATIHRIYSRTHADKVSYVPSCGLSRGPNDSWGPPCQVYHSVYECKLRFKPNHSRIWYRRGCRQRFKGSTFELMQIQCRMCPAWCGLSRGPNDSWGPPYQVYHSVYECKLRFKPNYSRICYQRGCVQWFNLILARERTQLLHCIGLSLSWWGNRVWSVE